MKPLLARLGADFGPATPVADLSLAQRQLVEIAKALSLDARLVIMDEPTSSLTASETARLLGVIADLKANGVSVIYISHRLQEVERCADRVLVLRDGKMVGHLPQGEIEHDKMIRLMIGRDLKSLYIPPAGPPREVALDLKEVRTTAFPAQTVNLALHAGEILGLAGLVGSGRTELARAIFGIDRTVGGEVVLLGNPVQITEPRGAIDRGLYLIPEDRKQCGLLLDFSVAENISLANLPAYARAAIVQGDAETRNAEQQKVEAADQGAVGRDPDLLALRRQPAEGRARQMAEHEPEGHHFRRADPRHRRRRQGRDLRADARPRRFRRRHPDDLQRHGGSDRRQRPDRGDA